MPSNQDRIDELERRVVALEAWRDHVQSSADRISREMQPTRERLERDCEEIGRELKAIADQSTVPRRRAKRSRLS
jgi:hypothetical protein